jgi:hypothetical protein
MVELRDVKKYLLIERLIRHRIYESMDFVMLNIL